MIFGRWGRSVAVLAVVLAAGCGRRGPPLQPFIEIPAAVEQISARRTGDEIYVTLSVPAQNVDGSVPVAIDRILVYGYTGEAPPVGGRWGEFATIVATVPVETPDVDQPTEDGPETPPVSADPPLPTLTGPIEPASVVVVRDVLTADEFLQGLRPPMPGAVSLAAPVVERPLLRYYTAFAFDARDRPSPPGGVTELTLGSVPPAPPMVRARYTEAELDLTWTPAGGLLGWLFERPLRAEAHPHGVRPPPRAPAPGPTAYNVYAAPADGGPAVGEAGESWRVAPVPPLNGVPLAEPSFSQPVQFGVEHCFVVRAARGTGAQAIEGPPSPRLCVTPEDKFPPAAPTGLAAFPGTGRIDLIWVPSGEPDLGGYVVLRGEAGDATLRPLNVDPVREARFLDDSVSGGTRYEYAVVALDARAPSPNRSVPSARVAVTAR